MENQGRLAGKVIVVGGGAGGSGAAVSRRLAAEGAHVVIGDIDLAGAEVLRSEIAANGGSASTQAFDLADRASIDAMIEAAARTHDRVDGVHMVSGNPAAMASDADLLTISFETWQSQIDTHLFGYAQAARSAIPLMRKRGGGSIVFTSSASCRSADVTRIGYQTAKSGVETLTRHIAHRYGKDGIRCNTIAYGVVLTDRAKAGLPQAFLDHALKDTWSPRLGEPSDIGGLAALLHSPDGEWLTGQVIDLNGGRLVRS